MDGGNYTSVSTILLKGKWIEEAGFKMDEYVAVKVEGDKITLTKDIPLEPKSSKSISDKIKDLDEAQLAKLSRFINKL